MRDGVMTRSLRVFVYRNLHRDCFSVVDLSTGRVAAHARGVLLRDARFVVREAGRQRALREDRRNVHAGVEGTLVIDPDEGWRPRRTTVVSYSPSRGPDFTDARGRPVREAAFAWLKDGKVHIPCRSSAC